MFVSLVIMELPFMNIGTLFERGTAGGKFKIKPKEAEHECPQRGQL